MTQPMCPKRTGVWLVCSHIREMASEAVPLVFQASSNGSGVAVTVKICGEVDLATVEELERQLEAVLAESGGYAMIIDLEALEFLAVCGVSALVDAQRRAEDAGREVRVTGARGAPARALRLLGLESWCEQPAGGDVRAGDEPR